MRSRYAAFALGLGAYLVRTLAVGHPDRETPQATLVRDLSRAHERQRFVGLRILQTHGDEVMFHARVFERGIDRSFVELSTFVREHDAWRYAAGIMMVTADLPADLESLSPDDLRKEEDR